MILLVVLVMLVSSGSCLDAVDVRLDPLARTTRDSSEAMCKALCKNLMGSAEPAAACKAFARAVPHPKMGRTCTRKFTEGYAFACPLLCSRLAGGHSGYLQPWNERLTHSACQDMSGNIPYPAVFNTCKQGYSQGLAAASAALSERFVERGVGSYSDDGTISDNPKTATGAEYGAAQLQQREGPALQNAAEVVGEYPTRLEAHPAREEGLPEVEAWMEALEAPLEYIDYSTVAKNRVSDARRRRGSDIKRGPACPVCGG